MREIGHPYDVRPSSEANLAQIWDEISSTEGAATPFDRRWEGHGWKSPWAAHEVFPIAHARQVPTRLRLHPWWWTPWKGFDVDDWLPPFDDNASRMSRAMLRRMYQEPPWPDPGERPPPEKPRRNRVAKDGARLALQQRWRLWRLKKEEILKKWIELEDWAKGVGGAGNPIGAGVGFAHLRKQWQELHDEWRKMRFDQMRGGLRKEPAQPEPGDIEDEARALREEFDALRRERGK